MAASTLSVSDRTYEVFRLDPAAGRLPYTLRILVENALRHGEDEDAAALLRWSPQAEPSDEISFRPARVLLQDFTGVPAIVDLAAMRNAMQDLGGDPAQINPQLPAELVIDHSVQVDEYASARHARFEPRQDGVWVQDLGSTNGTYLNGMRLEHPRRLTQGDIVRVGETDLRYED